MPTSGRCVTADTFVFKYGATNVAPIKEDQRPPPSKKRLHFQTRKRSWSEQGFGHGFYGAQNQEQLCWRGPAAI
jgi:hypothetical protein